jgi:hypothetical protein
VGAQPGSYVIVPAEQPNPARFLYEGNLPNAVGGPNDAARAVDRARYYCELVPRA